MLSQTFPGHGHGVSALQEAAIKVEAMTELSIQTNNTPHTILPTWFTKATLLRSRGLRYSNTHTRQSKGRESMVVRKTDFGLDTSRDTNKMAGSRSSPLVQSEVEVKKDFALVPRFSEVPKDLDLNEVPSRSLSNDASVPSRYVIHQTVNAPFGLVPMRLHTVSY